MSQEYLLSGPAGTGKTLSNLIKLLWFGSTYPGARLLIVRKTRHSLTETALVTWERDVLGDGHPIIARPIERSHRHAYKFPNRSVLVTGGMDKPDKVLSSEWDIIYVPEATELELTDWETLGGRLRANAGPFDQLIADVNPTNPSHWLYKRCMVGACRLYPTTHRDNPRYYDYRARRWTEAGTRYVKKRLGTMTGTRRNRFLLGLWVAAEGLVYDGYSPDVHLLPAGWAPDPAWDRVWAIDWGLTSPTVLQLWAVDGDGRMYLYREVFQTHLRADQLGAWARQQIDEGREPHPVAVVCDHDPDAKRDFEQAARVGLRMAEKKDQLEGIDAMQARFDVREDGKPGIYFAADCRETIRRKEADPFLVENGKPTCTVEELVSYSWDPNYLKDKPVDENDHGMDAARYSCMYVTKMVAARGWSYDPTPGGPHDHLPAGTFLNKGRGADMLWPGR